MQMNRKRPIAEIVKGKPGKNLVQAGITTIADFERALKQHGVVMYVGDHVFKFGWADHAGPQIGYLTWLKVLTACEQVGVRWSKYIRTD